MTIAAFGRALDVAARQADRMVVNLVNLVSPATAATLVRGLHAAAGRAGTTPPPVAAGTGGAGAAAAGSGRLSRGAGLRGHAPRSGFRRPDRLRAHPAAVPAEAIAAVGLAGSRAEVAAKIGEYAATGIDVPAIVPATGDDDPGGAKTLAACRSAVLPFDA
ncbi:hypothetical protein [Amycolatopsis sp.]|uniref:hypothetical protein n=1 Tax=Amycolatopsis sp. TaxID=37632 RepID=UPI002D809C47|nr:hypothetical protein [Amycolatopsis sp.]HET6706237.1 hypothetical protein [Amycolatopsis sp.]